MGLCNVIKKLGFRRAFDGTVNGITENSKCIEFTMCIIILAFFFRGNQKKCVHQVQVAMYNYFFLTVMQQDLTHIYTSNFLLFPAGVNISAANKENSFYADHVRFDYFFLIALLNKYEGLYHTVILWWFE